MEALQVNSGELVKQRENGDAVHDRGFEEEPFLLFRSQVAQLAVGVDDGSFVGGDGVGPVLEGGADVVDGGLAVFHVQGCSFEEDVGFGGGEPFADVRQLRIRLQDSLGIQTIRGGDPAKASGGDAGDAVGDAVAGAEFFGAVFEEADESPVNVAEAEEAEVVGVDATSQG